MSPEIESITIKTFGVMLSLACIIYSSIWIKTQKSTDVNFDNMHTILIEVVYDLMVDAKWDSAKSILSFIENDLKIEWVETNKRINVVNLALCELETGNKASAEATLSKLDWEASGLEYRAAVAAIRGRNDEAIEFIRRAFRAEILNREALIDWPVFNRLRKLKKFRDAFNELVGEEDIGDYFSAPKRNVHIGPGMQRLVTDGMKQVEEHLSQQRKKVEATAGGGT